MDELDATNNRAERQLRPAVITRKTTGCNRVADGAEAHSILASVLATCHQRAIPILDFFVELQRCCRKPADTRPAAARPYLEAFPGDDEDPLWVGQRGPLHDRGAVFRIVKKYALIAGIDEISPHTLRHTFATRYLTGHPGDLRSLAAILGHASLDTVTVYTEPTTEEIARRMEEAEVVSPLGN